jgi:dihydrofolate synthase/folylpolyglutamate synthase
VIQVNGRVITQKAMCEGVEYIRQACDEMVNEGFPHPTFFEIQTALAFWYFRRKACEIVVLETGMGGLMDATNLIRTTKVAVLANISMDHMQYLGKTLREIATQKAGIVKPGCRVVSMVQQTEAMQVVENTAHENGCELTIADASLAKYVKYGVEKQSFDYKAYKKLTIKLAGRFQIANAILAIEAVEALRKSGYNIPEKALYQGLLETIWQGRFTVIGKKPLFIVDGAHNEDAAQKLADSIEFYFTNKRIVYIIGVLKDKEYEKIIGLTHQYADQIITVTPPENPRGLHAYELAQTVAGVHPNVTAVDSLEEAVEMSYLLAGKDDVILAFGSLSYLGRLIKIVERRDGKHGRS